MIGLLLALIYLAFISLGLPDAVLGSAWPLISNEFGVATSSMGIVTIIISAGTIISSLNSNKLINKLGVYKVTVLSVLITAISLYGYSISPDFIALCLWSIPYGLGAGSIDAALNNYVAINFESKHMSWLHCMWGLGATTGPYIMGMVLTNGQSFRSGFIVLFAIQAVLTVILFASAPVWKLKSMGASEEDKNKKVLNLKEVFQIKGVKEIALAFFCFCSIEHTTGLWASSYLVFTKGIAPELAASLGALFYLGITIGRGICGFIAMKYSDRQMIRAGIIMMAIGVIVVILPINDFTSILGIALIGFGSSPVYPCIIHSTPENFGIKNSQAITGVQMASAYTGTLTMPAIFGIIGREISFELYPIFIGILLFLLYIMYEKMLKTVKGK